LIHLYADELGRLRGVRRARWLAWAVAVASVLSMLMRRDTGPALLILSIEALGWLSWLVGGSITWSALRNWRTFQAPLADMARERGVGTAWLDLAAPLALIRQLSLWVGVPALSLTLFALGFGAGARVSWSHPGLLLLVPGYVVIFALGLGLLTFVSTKLLPEAATSAFLVIVLIPHACRELWPHTPSIIGMYVWLWNELVYLGAMA